MSHESFVNGHHAAIGLTVGAFSTLLPDGLSDGAKLLLAFPTGMLTMLGAAVGTAIVNKIKAHYAAKSGPPKHHPRRRSTDAPPRNKS